MIHSPVPGIGVRSSASICAACSPAKNNDPKESE
jgi:hypothetical protein